MDTRISSLSYIKLKRLDNDIKTKSISKTCTNYETKGKPRKKKPHPGIEPEFNKNLGVHGAEQFNADTIGHIAVDIRSVITCTVQVNRTSWLRQKNDEKFCKITKICLLETK